ncbi:MAG: hypothetical protein OEZ39_06935 [Gammaproteobacteria bacterium]|nr:hypothetical protein [Gammaproteobacteria bacterium]MDH5651591.1 hypothetical protein [Gammaproteobacteria bacterium]
MSSLFLCPDKPDWLPENDRILVDALQSLGLLGQGLSLPTGAGYLPGERFFQFVSFMGCAPGLKLEPASSDDEKFCHLRVHYYPEPVFLYLRGERQARCPVCRKPGICASEYAAQGGVVDTCPVCQANIAPGRLDWRKEAGQAGCLLEIREVYPHEGVPTDHLLQQLQSVTSQTWIYFYA